MKNKICFSFFLVLFISIQTIAQPRQELVKVIVAPDKADWTYQAGERAIFTISVLKNNVMLDGVEVKYKIQPELVDVLDEGTLKLKNGTATVKSDKFKTPGFLRCTASVEVDGKTYSSYATAGFSPNEIKPTTNLPEDFEAFWNKGKEDLAKIPIRPVLTLMPERCTDKADVYHVSINNIKGKI